MPNKNEAQRDDVNAIVDGGIVNVNLKDKVVVLKKGIIKDDSDRRFFAESGFGCTPGLRGSGRQGVIRMDDHFKHYTAAPLPVLLPRVQSTKATCKPVGFWLATDDSWASFCSRLWPEDMRLCYDVKLTADANILRISTPAELLAFTDLYGEADAAFTSFISRPVISWSRVAADYQGIVISPYIHSLRHDSSVFWYYGWDVASACIWDTSAIASVELVKEEAPYESVSLQS